MEFRVGVGEWWVRSQESVVRGQESGVRGQESVVGVQSWSWRAQLAVERSAFLASDAVARMCGLNCDIHMGDGIRSERLGNIPQSGTWARAVSKNAPRTSRQRYPRITAGGGASRLYFLPPLNAAEPERARR